MIAAVAASEAADYWSRDPDRVNGYGALGGQRSMFSNRLSYAFDFHGPSYTIDSGCSGSLSALQQGFQSIRSGQCDAAIIGGVHLVLKPTESLNFQKLNMLSPNGRCKSFDASGKRRYCTVKFDGGISDLLCSTI